jgi:hypothetical protein
LVVFCAAVKFRYIPDAAFLCARVLSSISTQYGAAAAQIIAVYEKFPGEAVSVLLFLNLLFLQFLSVKRNDTNRPKNPVYWHFHVVPCF